MARIGRWAGRGVLLLLLALVVGAAGLALWLRTSLPQEEGERALAGLAAPVEIARDADGIPHIKAASLLDAWQAIGFIFVLGPNQFGRFLTSHPAHMIEMSVGINERLVVVHAILQNHPRNHTS